MSGPPLSLSLAVVIVVCQHTSTDTFWPVNASGSCSPLVIADTRTTLHSDQQLAIVGGMADGFAGGFVSIAGQPGLWLLVVTILVCKGVLRMLR